MYKFLVDVQTLSRATVYYNITILKLTDLNEILNDLLAAIGQKS